MAIALRCPHRRGRRSPVAATWSSGGGATRTSSCRSNSRRGSDHVQPAVPSDQVAVTTTIGGWFPEKYWIRLSVPSSNSVWKRSPLGLLESRSEASLQWQPPTTFAPRARVARSGSHRPGCSTRARRPRAVSRWKEAAVPSGTTTRISPFPISLWRAYPASDLTERVGKGVDRNRFFEPPGRLTEPGSVPIVGLGARAAAPEGGRPGAQSERVGHAPERPHPNARGCLAPPPLAAYLPRYRARNP
jgi:hypothetical protein